MPENYIRLVQDIHRGCKTVVRSAAGECNSFVVAISVPTPDGCVDRVCEKGRTLINDVRR